MIEGLLVGAAVGLLTAGLAGPILRWLPEPDAEEPKIPYRDLAGARFLLGCGLLSAGATAIAWLALPRPVQPLWWVLSSAGLLLATIDARTTWLPLRLTRFAWVLMGAAALGAAAWTTDGALALRAAIGAAVAGVLYLLVWWASRGGFGFGDVRFAPLLGAATASQSWGLLLWGLTLGTAAGALHGGARLAGRRQGGFPYAPSMLLGCYLAVLALEIWPGQGP